eukprot:scaffold84681_cov21-Tisochrysis_lutea.AAC.1
MRRGIWVSKSAWWNAEGCGQAGNSPWKDAEGCWQVVRAHGRMQRDACKQGRNVRLHYTYK